MTFGRIILTYSPGKLLDDPLPALHDARLGCPKATEAIVEAILPIVQQTASGLTRDHAMAEDVAQDATIKVLTRLHAYNPKWKLSTWVRVVTRNTFIDRFRRRKRWSTGLPLHLSCPRRTPDVCLEDAERDEWVRSSVDALPTIYREVILMHHFQHLKYREIADALGVPIGTVMNRIYRARQKLLAGLQPIAA